MTTKTQDRLLGLTVLALLVTIAGELLATTLLVTVGVTTFFLAVVGLFTLMTATLVIGVSERSGSDVDDPVLADPTRSATPPGDH